MAQTVVALKGYPELMRTLHALPPRIGKRVLYNAARKAGPVATRAIKPLVPVETGSLKRSFGQRVYMHRRGFGAGVVIGPRRGFTRIAVRGRRGWRSARHGEMFSSPGGARAIKRTPANYAHLVEEGHRIVVGGTAFRLGGKRAGKAARSLRTGMRGGGRVVGTVPGRGFMRRGWAAAQSAVYHAVVNALSEGIAKHAGAAR